MASELKKKYGLVLSKKKESEESKLKAKIATVFNDDEDETAPTTSNKESASVIRVQKAAQREHERALAEDPSIFDYDGAYDEIQAIKDEKKEEQKKADTLRESKYASEIIKAHKRREIETHSREERQQQKERVKEGDMFADKEVFVTGAYRKQMEEVQKFRQEEAIEARFNELTSVERQKLWEVGMGRTLLNDISRSGDVSEKLKKRRERARERINDSPSPTREAKPEDKKEIKKSIYSDDEDEPPAPEPPKKNFEGELKPGLNRVVKKASTKAERLQRNFTPTPPSSDDEGRREDRSRRGRDDENSHREDRQSRRKDSNDDKKRESVDEPPAPIEKRKMSNKEKLKVKKIDKEERLRGLKEILKQRNTEEDIEQMRQRYKERLASGVVVPPL